MKTKLSNTLKKAMLEKNQLLISTIRSILTKVTEAEKAKGQELTDDAILKVIEKLSKQREEAIALYTKGGRPELAEKERTELEILNSYLPEKYDLDKTEKIIKGLIEDGHTNMGAIMKGLAVYGNLIDKKLASEIIKKELV